MTVGARTIPRGRIAVLGIITIAVYGSWYYSFGVLLDPIIEDTGWHEPLLTSAFATSLLIAGVGAFAGGWFLDRAGSRAVFGVAALVGVVSFTVATMAQSALLFAASGAIGGGIFGALGFYHVTQTVAVRISPADTTKAIAVLTIWGAFASAIYMPIAAWIVEPIGWRWTLRLVTLSAVAALLVGMGMINTRTEAMPQTRHLLAELRRSLAVPATRRFVIATGLVGIGAETILVYQVPTMTAAGLPLAAASFWAGFRGFAQLGGRLPLMPIVNRLGTVNSLRLAFAAIAVGGLLLAVAGTPALAALYAVIAGFGIGASSPLNGMHARDVFGPSSLGTSMGLLSLVFLVVGSIGPASAGWVAAATGSRSVVVVGGAAVTLVAVFLIRRPDQPKV